MKGITKIKYHVTVQAVIRRLLATADVGSIPSQITWNLRWKRWYWGRFSLSDWVSPEILIQENTQFLSYIIQGCTMEHLRPKY
jgi:hypothetical protein